MSSRTHPHTYTYTHPCAPMYARIRTREGNFLTSNLLYSIAKPSSIISPTPFTSIIQSLYNPYPYCHHIGCVICTNCQHLLHIYHPLSTITQLSAIHSIICQSSPIYYHCHQSSRTHHIPSLSDFQSNQSTILSICQYVIKPYQFSIYLPHFSSVFSYTTDFCSTNPTIIIFIMETVFRANHQLSPLCIIIHLLIFVMKFV